MNRLLLVLLLGCSSSQTAADIPDKPLELGRKVRCQRACARLAELKCEAAKPTPEGAPCFEVCTEAAKTGIDLTVGLEEWSSCP